MFKDKLVCLMTEKGISAKQLQHDLKLANATYQSWIDGIRIPRLGNLSTLADYLDVSVDELLDGSTPGRRYTYGNPASVEFDIDLDKPLCSIQDKVKGLASCRGQSLVMLSRECRMPHSMLLELMMGRSCNVDYYQILANHFEVPVWALLSDEPIILDELSTKGRELYSVTNIGPNLVSLRAMQGWPVSKACQLAQISQVTYKNYETGKMLCSLDALQSLCQVYSTNMKEVTSRLQRSSVIREWFAHADQYSRLRYLKIVRGLKIGDMSLQIGCKQDELFARYRNDNVTEHIAKRLANSLNVPVSWVYGDAPLLGDNTEIK